MDAEKTIAEIESLERIHALPDTRLFSAADREAANRFSANSESRAAV